LVVGFSESISKRLPLEYKPETQQFDPNCSLFPDYERDELKSSAHVKDKNCKQNLSQKKCRPKRRWKDYIKMDVTVCDVK